MQGNGKSLQSLANLGAKKRSAQKQDDDDTDDPIKEQLRLAYHERIAREKQQNHLLSQNKQNIESGSGINTDADEECKEKPTNTNTINNNNKQKTVSNFQIPDAHRLNYFINKLQFYPPDQVNRKYMFSFPQIFYEDMNLDHNMKLQSGANRKTTAETVYMTTYGYETVLFNGLLKQGVKVILQNDCEKGKYVPIQENFCDYKNFTLIQMRREQIYGCFHPKLWLIKFPLFLRVVVGSGNLTEFDWSIWSNGVWFQDFPRKNLSQIQKEDLQQSMLNKEEFDYNSDFQATLTRFVSRIMPSKQDSSTSQRYPYQQILGFSLDDYLFENINVVLIESVAGRHTGAEMLNQGQAKVSHVLKHKQFQKECNGKFDDYMMTAQTTSMGNIDSSFIANMWDCFFAHGKTLHQLKLKGSEKSHKKGEQTNSDTIKQQIVDQFQLIYPTNHYIQNCAAGAENAAPLIFNDAYYQKEEFPKGSLCKYEGNPNFFFHDGMIPHVKSIIVTKRNNMQISDESIIYLGSHNFSQAAWGKFEKGFSQLSFNNTELGILIPPQKESQQRKQALIRECLPFKFPPTPMGKEKPFTKKFNY